jgi:hypothetical protein
MAAPTGLVVHRWLLGDGEDEQGAASLAAAAGVWYQEGDRAYAQSRVTGQDGLLRGGFVATQLSLPDNWTFDVWFALDVANDRGSAPDLTLVSLETSDPLDSSIEGAGAKALRLQISCPSKMTNGTVRLLADDIEVASVSQPGLCIPRSGPIYQRRKTIVWHQVRLRWDAGALTAAVDGVPLAAKRTTGISPGRRAMLRAGIGAANGTGPGLIEGEAVWLDEMLLRSGPPPQGDPAPAVPRATRRAWADHAARYELPPDWKPIATPIEPAAFSRLPYRAPFEHPTFDIGGHYLALAGFLDGALTARHRLVLAADLQLTRHTETVLQVRTLETRTLAATGSMIGLPRSAQLTSAGDFTLTLEQAWIARNSEAERSPIFFGAGRLPTGFGVGISEQNGRGAIDPPDWSPTAVFGHSVEDDATVRADAYGDRTFPSTLDGFALGLRFRQRRDERAEWLQLRVGRRNPECLGRTIDVPGVDDAGATEAVEAVEAEAAQQERTVGGPLDACPLPMRSVYEAAMTFSADSPRLLGERTHALSAIAVGWGLRWRSTTPKPHVLFGESSTLLTTARTGKWWVRFAADAVAEVPVWEAEQIEDPIVPVPVEDLGNALGGALQFDLSSIRVPFLVGSLALGGDGSYLVYGNAGGALHPDFDVDMVGFEQVVADITARAYTDSDSLAPSLGGVSGGGYARITLTGRWADLGEMPISLIYEHNTLEIPDELEPGALGWEVDWALRFHVAGWRLATGVGAFLPGGALATPADVTHTSVSFRLARNL